MIRSIRAVAIALPAIALAACSHAESRSASYAEPGSEASANPEVQEVSGKVYRSSHQSITIQPTEGPERTLKIAPHTAIAISGQRSTVSEISEGQQVSASYTQVNGRDVAVAIESFPGAGAGTTPNVAQFGGGVGGGSGGTIIRIPQGATPSQAIHQR